MKAFALFLPILLLAGCAPSHPLPYSPPSRPSFKERKQTTLLKQYMESDKQLLAQLPSGNDEKLELGIEALKRADRYSDIYNDPTASRDEQRWALEMKASLSKDAGRLISKAADGYAQDGQRDKARETYWMILRTFTGTGYTALRQSAETELKYMDEVTKRNGAPQLDMMR